MSSANGLSEFFRRITAFVLLLNASMLSFSSLSVARRDFFASAVLAMLSKVAVASVYSSFIASYSLEALAKSSLAFSSAD